MPAPHTILSSQFCPLTIEACLQLIQIAFPDFGVAPLILNSITIPPYGGL